MGDPAERFRIELAKLAAATELALVEDDDGGSLVLESPGFVVRAHLEPAQVTIKLEGWERSFELSGSPDDADDEISLALDLVAAAAFGTVRLLVKRVGGKARAWTLQLREPDGWNTISSAGKPSINPFAKKDTVELVNAVPRPAAYAPAKHLGLPWAPWAGAGGFCDLDHQASEHAQLPIDGVLDLHDFHPKEVKALVLEYIEQCRERGILQLRIIHGKGTGQLRRTVHSILDKHEHVTGYELGGHGGGSWGATIVDLAPRG